MAAVSHARVSFRTPPVWCRTLGALFPRLLPFVDHPWEPPWSFAPLSVCSFCFCTFELCILWLKILVAWVYWLAHDSCDMKPHWLTKTECETSESTGSEAGKPYDKWQTYSFFVSLVWSQSFMYIGWVWWVWQKPVSCSGHPPVLLQIVVYFMFHTNLLV